MHINFTYTLKGCILITAHNVSKNCWFRKCHINKEDKSH